MCVDWNCGWCIVSYGSIWIMFHNGFNVPLGSDALLINVFLAIYFLLFFSTEVLSPNVKLSLSGVILIGDICVRLFCNCLLRGIVSDSASESSGVLYWISRFDCESEKLHMDCWSSIGRLRIFLSKLNCFILLYVRLFLFGCVTMLFLCLFGFPPNCASNGVIFVVVFGMSFIFFIIADILFASVSLDQLLSMIIAASRLFNAWINFPTIPVPLWSPVGASISFILLSLRKISKFFALFCAWSHLCDLGIPWNFIYSFS